MVKKYCVCVKPMLCVCVENEPKFYERGLIVQLIFTSPMSISLFSYTASFCPFVVHNVCNFLVKSTKSRNNGRGANAQKGEQRGFRGLQIPATEAFTLKCAKLESV